MTRRLQAWAESWPVFLAMCAWLVIWTGLQLAEPEVPGGARDGGPSNAAQAAEGVAVHRVD